MAWRDRAARVDRAAARAFDYGDVYFQKVAGLVEPAGRYLIPADFSDGFASAGNERIEGGTLAPSVTVHYGDFRDGLLPAAGDRFILDTGPAAGVYVVDRAEDNDDRTGALCRLRRATMTV